MIEIYPKYYEKFKCKAGTCTDSCCRGWEIDIDKDTMASYEDMPWIREKICDGHFVLNENGDCPFLNSHGLCDIYDTLGKDTLCQICSDHPRYFNTVEDYSFSGVGMCCEVACELILHGDGALNEMPNLPSFCTELSKDFCGYDIKVGQLSRLFEMLLTHEIIKDEWRELLHEMTENAVEIDSKIALFLQDIPWACDCFNNVYRYFVYRHYPDSQFYEDESYGVLCELQLANLCTQVILFASVWLWLKHGAFRDCDMLNICKLVSQEIEYDDDIVFDIENFK